MCLAVINVFHHSLANTSHPRTPPKSRRVFVRLLHHNKIYLNKFMLKSSLRYYSREQNRFPVFHFNLFSAHGLFCMSLTWIVLDSTRGRARSFRSEGSTRDSPVVEVVTLLNLTLVSTVAERSVRRRFQVLHSTYSF